MSGGKRRRDYRKLTTAGIACALLLLAELALAAPAMGQGNPTVFNNAPTITLPSGCSTTSVNFLYTLGNVTSHANGTLDLVMICGQNIVVVPGNGDGTFAPASAQSTPFNLSGPITQISLADVDGDGNLDLIITDNTCNVDVFLGTGSGTFSSTAQKTMEPVYCGSAPELFVVADFNGDNKPDIALQNTNNGAPSVTVFLNTSVKGAVKFGASTVTVGASGQQFSAMTFGNFTGHTAPAVPDLAVTVGVFASGIGFTDQVFVLQNNGAGTAFTALPGVTLPVTKVTGTVTGLAAANFSSDGFLDLAAVDFGDGVIYVLNGHGTGYLSSCSSPGSTTTIAPCQTTNGQTITGLPLSFGRHILAGNFNGSPGLLFASANECMSVLLSATGGGLQTTPTNYVVGASATNIVMADVNNDGFQDAIAAWNNGLRVFLNNTGGTLEGTQAFIAGEAPGEISLLQNFFGNGELDLAVVPINAGTTGSSAAVTVFGAPASGPNGTFPQSSGPIPAPPGQSITAMTTGCVLVPVNNSSPCVTPFVAYATYEAAITTAFGFAFTTATGGPASDIGSALSSQQITAIAAGDFNGDGKTDLAFAIGKANTILVFTGNGDGTFSKTPLTISLGAGANPVALAVADFNADGMTDIAVLNQSNNTIGILMNNTSSSIGSSLSFATMVPYPTGLTSPTGFTVGDFNGDNKADVAAVSSNEIAILLNQGSGVFPTTAATPIPLPTSSFASAIATGDFNGDGILDLAVTLPFNPDTVEILNGKGDGTFTTSTTTSWSVGANPAAMVVGNFKGSNGNGLPDIAVADGDPAGNTVAVLLNGPAAPPPNTPPFAQYSNIGPIQFGPVNVGTPYTQSLILTNTGSTAFMVNGVSLSNINPAFTITSVVCNGSNVPPPFSASVTLATGGTCTINLQFLSTVNGNGQSELLTVATTTTNSNASAGPGGIGQAFLLVGDAVEPFANYSPTTLNFGNVIENTPTTQTVAVANTGTGPLIIQLARIAPGTGFSYTQAVCNSVVEPSPLPSPLTISAGSSCTFTVQFDPNALGSLSGSLGIADNAGVGESNLISTTINATTFQQDVSLSGTGVASSPPPPAIVTDNEMISVSDSPSFPEVSDSEAITVTDTASVTACQMISILPASPLPLATVGTPYTLQFSPAGLTWATSGSVPPGLTMNSTTGVLSGTPTGSGGTFNFTVTAIDSNGCPGSANVSLTVNAAPTGSSTTTITSTSSTYQGVSLPANFALLSDPVTVKFSVQAVSATPTGTVKVTDGFGDSCTGNLTGGTGSCAISISQLGNGSTPLTATYAPDVNSSQLLPSVSSASTENIVQVTACGSLPSIQTSAQGTTVTFTFMTCSLLDVQNAPQAVVTGCPPDAQCSAAVTPTPGKLGVDTVVVTIVLGSANIFHGNAYPSGEFLRVPLFWYCVFLAMLAIVQMARQNRARPRLLYAAVFLLALLLSGLSGCNNASSANGTPPNTYTVNVTITAGTSNVTVPLTLTVTK